jgi:hypothetical protein
MHLNDVNLFLIADGFTKIDLGGVHRLLFSTVMLIIKIYIGTLLLTPPSKRMKQKKEAFLLPF